MKKTMTQIFFIIAAMSLNQGCSEQKVQNKKVLINAPLMAKSSETKKSKPIDPEVLTDPVAPTDSKIDIKNCICVQLWLPVCGENAKTYSNSCFANCAGVKFKQGSCTKTITD